MGDKSGIEWTDATWNPIVGCSRVSKGCEHCYAEGVAHRGMHESHKGLTVLGKHGPRWTGEVRFVPDRLADPLRWRKPRRVFVNSMSDLFHERVTDRQIASVFAAMSMTPQHTFQILTKRPARMREWFPQPGQGEVWCCSHDVRTGEAESPPEKQFVLDLRRSEWPLPNVWLGVSVEDQATADERIPLLLDTPAAVRFVSYEPALGPVDFKRWMWPVHPRWPIGYASPEAAAAAGGEVTYHRQALVSAHARFIDWIIVGGESGPGARPFDLAWTRAVLDQGRKANVPVFVKQLGARPFERIPPTGAPDDGGDLRPLSLRDRKGGDCTEWPHDVRVREFPSEGSR